MTKQNKLTDADMFFSAMKFKDVQVLRKTYSFFMLLALIFMFVLATVSMLFAFTVTMKPTPVIAFDKDGKKAVFSPDDTVESETSKVRIHRFMTEFVNKFEGVSPNIEEDLKDAYNMLTPKFRQILLDKAVHKEKIDSWKNKNFETQFIIKNLKILKGSFEHGSSLTLEGIGEMTFKNVINYSGENEQRKDFVYFSALLIVTPVSFELSPDGLFVEFYHGKSLGDFRSLRAYLLENKKEYLIDGENKEVFE
ncbi:MAG TPA: hypothetical protein PLX56_04095 [bacterium]|nr:hypothetical protein [bacterium]HQN72823.1 hypothetical protein [bacterium]HQO91491.1 hypothetical protein [bacterium]